MYTFCKTGTAAVSSGGKGQNLKPCTYLTQNHEPNHIPRDHEVYMFEYFRTSLDHTKILSTHELHVSF